jgi:hypothetical protein
MIDIKYQKLVSNVFHARRDVKIVKQAIRNKTGFVINPVQKDV